MMVIGVCRIWRHRSGTPLVPTGLVVFVVFLICLQINYLLSRGIPTNPTSELNGFNAAMRNMIPALSQMFLPPKPSNSTNLNLNGDYNNVVYENKLNISAIKLTIAQYNEQQFVYNENIFGPLQNMSLVIVIQVHDRIAYLRHLIASLSQAQGIAQALIVFSHDYYDEEINSLIQSVDFCKVIQIFYPYSIQTYPNKFPGNDPEDCPRDINKEQALLKKCKNAPYPDLYGHYREAKYTQIKHHWWWKAKHVFNKLKVTRNHSGLVLFLEEDHYVAEDFIHFLKLMEKTCRESCKHCNILSLATSSKMYNYNGDASKKVEINPAFSNMGMAFNRTTWAQITSCSTYFCEYDDYNWDWSLMNVAEKCWKGRLHAMVALGPRVFHIGECGLHHKKGKCDTTAVVSNVQKVLQAAKRDLYPDNLIVSHTKETKKLLNANGGWGDRRDQKLCMAMTNK